MRLAALALATVSSQASAQHAGHAMPPGMKMDKPVPVPKPVPKPAPRPIPKPVPKPARPATKPKPAPVVRPRPAPTPPAAAEPMDHSGMEGMDGMADMPTAPEGSTMEGMDHSKMDHSTMDHSAMPMPADPAPTVETPPPPEAGAGPARAADAIWGADAMRTSRDRLRYEQGGQTYFWFMADRAEYRAHAGRDGYLWDLQGYYGGDLDKLWVKSEGEGAFGEAIDQAEVQVLWSHAIAPFFDAQVGVRQDFAGPDRTHLVAGVQGLAPYRFEVDAAAFLSTKGDLTARVEVELDQRITQRLILQPRGEVNLAAQDVLELGIGAGLDSVELGLRLRYEIAREFAPYIGIAQEWRVGGSRDFARARGDDPSVISLVAGVRLWF